MCIQFSSMQLTYLGAGLGHHGDTRMEQPVSWITDEFEGHCCIKHLRFVKSICPATLVHGITLFAKLHSLACCKTVYACSDWRSGIECETLTARRAESCPWLLHLPSTRCATEASSWGGSQENTFNFPSCFLNGNLPISILGSLQFTILDSCNWNRSWELLQIQYQKTWWVLLKTWIAECSAVCSAAHCC